MISPLEHFSPGNTSFPLLTTGSSRMISPSSWWRDSQRSNLKSSSVLVLRSCIFRCPTFQVGERPALCGTSSSLTLYTWPTFSRLVCVTQTGVRKPVREKAMVLWKVSECGCVWWYGFLSCDDSSEELLHLTLFHLLPPTIPSSPSKIFFLFIATEWWSYDCLYHFSWTCSKLQILSTFLELWDRKKHRAQIPIMHSLFDYLFVSKEFAHNTFLCTSSSLLFNIIISIIIITPVGIFFTIITIIKSVIKNSNCILHSVLLSGSSSMPV